MNLPIIDSGFNTQPPEGGWPGKVVVKAASKVVSTHSRPKAAGWSSLKNGEYHGSFNTQPPEGGWQT